MAERTEVGKVDSRRSKKVRWASTCSGAEPACCSTSASCCQAVASHASAAMAARRVASGGCLCSWKNGHAERASLALRLTTDKQAV